VFVSDKPFQPSLMLAVGNVRSLPLSGAPERSFSKVSSGLTHKHYTRLERVAKDKYSSLLGPFVSYAEGEVL
jgi:hypothetical protein